MNKDLKRAILLYMFWCSLTVSSCLAQEFSILYSPSVFPGPFSGKVILYLSKNNPRPKECWIEMQRFSCFSIEVHNVLPDTTVLFDDSSLSYPVKLSDLERGQYYAQAVWDRDLGEHSISRSAGNLYSDPVTVDLTKNEAEQFQLICNHIIQRVPFEETQYVKELRVPSELLHDFDNRMTTINAAVLLPETYFDDSKAYPVLFTIGGFDSDYYQYYSRHVKSDPIDTIDCINVFLDGRCRLGHSCYANSDNNGPWGDALVREFIPELEKQFRCNGARFVTGHSSGGWSALWLQIQYPQVFAGCWASSPDPVDFRCFQKVNLYEDKNLFYDKKNRPNPFMTLAGAFPIFYTKDAYAMERVISRGEQMQSYNAVFGYKTANGPESLCDPETGEIDSAVVAHWKRYDISLYLKENWHSLAPCLDGKIRISIGEHDNFLLHHAVHRLEQEMKNMCAHMVFDYYPGDHYTILSDAYQDAGNRFLAQKYEEWLAACKKEGIPIRASLPTETHMRNCLD